jgi:hypothetical protein
MKTILRLEELAMFGLSVYAFTQTDFAWWWWFVLILAPDIGMLGYIFGNRAGAFTYNAFHHKAIAITIFLLGLYLPNTWLEIAGIMMFGHSSLDRMLGYGLKYSDSFRHTHLGWLRGKGETLSGDGAGIGR